MLLGFQIYFPELEGKWNGPGCQILMASKILYEKRKLSQLNHHLIIFAYEILHWDQEFGVGKISVNLIWSHF